MRRRDEAALGQAGFDAICLTLYRLIAVLRAAMQGQTVAA